jgi:hypothetical protein
VDAVDRGGSIRRLELSRETIVLLADDPFATQAAEVPTRGCPESQPRIACDSLVCFG